MSIRLGMIARDCVTGFRGMVTARTEFLYATPQVCLVATTLKDALPIAGQWFDEQRVVEDGDQGNVGHFI